MNNIRCNNCSFLNFTASESCKRCGAPLATGEGNEAQALQFHQPVCHSGQSYYPQANSFTGQSQPYFEDSETRHGSKLKLGAWTWLSIVCLLAVVGFRLYMRYGGAGEPPESAWKMFTPKDNAFSVLMPGEPKVESVQRFKQVQMQSTTTKYELDTEGGSTFVVVYLEYKVFPPNMTADKAFDDVVDGISSQAPVLSRKEVILDGHPAMELEIGRPVAGGNTGTYKGVMHLYWAPPRVYAVGADGPDTSDASASRKKFLDSFKIN
ncbi:MAG: zinc finger Ran-binding domain-containing protein [Acidobacteriota bacterium]|nr:zinc finger Ran-binding domain-containing protein [Acidobacteriota bacterium]